MGFPQLRSTVLDATDARGLAEFYRELLGWSLHPDDDGDPEWVVVVGPQGQRLAFQQVPSLPPSTWPGDEVPQQLHLDFSVPDRAELDAQHERALGLGAQLRFEDLDEPEQPIRIYADPAGHPFCIFVVAPALPPQSPADDDSP
jgi:catechol 2,3-dioxygenase-like lactoylglutathione lyase family enzyme